MDAVLETHGVTVRELRALRQHNLYAYMPVLRAIVDIGRYVEHGSDKYPELAIKLPEMLPGLHTHECSVGRPGGFIERLKRGTYLPHISEHVCIELQNLMGFHVAFGRARNGGERGV